MTSLLVFVVLSLPLVAISWKSLRVPGSHGFYRYFAWDAILGLLVINVPIWFHDPFSWHQLVSWILLMASFIPLGFGIRALRMHGRASRGRESDPSLYAFEKTTELVTTGIFTYIRHPLYSSLLLLAWGVMFKSLTWISGLLVIAATIFLVATAKADEHECISFFGEKYRQYMRHTKMFIPYFI